MIVNQIKVLINIIVRFVTYILQIVLDLFKDIIILLIIKKILKNNNNLKHNQIKILNNIIVKYVINICSLIIIQLINIINVKDILITYYNLKINKNKI